MIKNQKILVTGASGSVASSLVKALAPDNEVWGAARFANPAARQAVESAGAKTIALDLGSGEFAGLPNDFSYVVHLAYYRGGMNDFDQAVRVNGEGTGFLLHHCRTAKAALVMSANTVYAPHEDPWYAPKEDAAIGGMIPPWAPTSSTSKIAQEAVARYCARNLGLPVTIARLNTVYGPGDRFLPITNMDAVVQGKEIAVRSDPYPHAPIHVEDIYLQLEAMLDAASVPATIVNWVGDEVVTAQQWCAYVAGWSGKPANLRLKPVPGAPPGGLADPVLRRSITGPCAIRFVEGYRAIYDQRHPAG
jgi:nucleoside-diphosphate-sugar epimerase